MFCRYAVDALSGFYAILSGSVTTSNQHLQSLPGKDSVLDPVTPMHEDKHFKSSKVKPSHVITQQTGRDLIFRFY